MGRSPGKFGFWSILGPQKSRQNGQLAFESGGVGATSKSGSMCPLSQRKTAPGRRRPVDDADFGRLCST